MKTTKILAAASSVFSGLFLASAAYAQSASSILTPITGGVNTPIMDLVYRLINYAIGLAALICVVMLIVAGYSYITAGGDSDKVEKATKTLTNAIIGLVICLIAVILVQFVLKTILQVA